jgi:hypothetical protein
VSVLQLAKVERALTLWNLDEGLMVASELLEPFTVLLGLQRQIR